MNLFENQVVRSQVANKSPALLSMGPRKVLTVLCTTAAALFVINVTSLLLAASSTGNQFVVNALLYFFDASLEGNIPTLFTVLILFVCSMLLLLLFFTDGAGKRTSRKYWLSLSLIFLFLTVDEAVQVHEQFNKLRSVIPQDHDGYLTYPWILPYALAAAVAFIFFLGFLRRLPSRSRNLFLVSGAVYVLSALGFEVVEGRVAQIYGTGHLYDKLICSIEEFLEMTGLIMFIYALLDYLHVTQRKVVIAFTPG